VSYVRYAFGFGAVLLAPMLSSRPALAHARWFVDDKQLPPGPGFQLDRIYASTLVGALIFAIGAIFLESASRRNAAFYRVLKQPIQAENNAVWRVLSVTFGLTLIISSMTRVLVAPNLRAGPGLGVQAIMFLQIIVGSIFVIQSRLMVGSALAVLLPFSCAWLYSVTHAIDYAFEVVGFSAALFLVGPSLSAADRDLQAQLLAVSPIGLRLRITTPSRSFCWAWRTSRRDGAMPDSWQRERLAVSILRTLLGLQLVVLAAHDKLLEPAVSLAFVDKYPFVNFPALLGATSFTNLHFVFGAGMAEVTFGALLMANIATRAVCGILTFMFVATGITFGVGELVGHLPIVAALLVLMAHGSGKAAAPLTFASWQRVFLGAAGVAAAVLLIAVFAPSSNPARVPSADGSTAVPGASA
jgi:hypothetical protein